VRDGKLVFVPALANQARCKYRVAADQKRAPGKPTITFDFACDGGVSSARSLGASVASPVCHPARPGNREPEGWHNDYLVGKKAARAEGAGSRRFDDRGR
jgi:hypothetical protein